MCPKIENGCNANRPRIELDFRESVNIITYALELELKK